MKPCPNTKWRSQIGINPPSVDESISSLKRQCDRPIRFLTWGATIDSQAECRGRTPLPRVTAEPPMSPTPSVRSDKSIPPCASSEYG